MTKNNSNPANLVLILIYLVLRISTPVTLQEDLAKSTIQLQILHYI